MVDRRGALGDHVVRSFGQAGDLAVPGDYDGDGIADLGIFRRGNGQWWLERSREGLAVLQVGAAGDEPVPGDYNRDGRLDAAVVQPGTSGPGAGLRWIIDNGFGTQERLVFGLRTDVAAPAGYVTR